MPQVTTQVTATQTAADLIAELKTEHGELIFHLNEISRVSDSITLQLYRVLDFTVQPSLVFTRAITSCHYHRVRGNYWVGTQ